MNRDPLYVFEISLHRSPPETAVSGPYADAWGLWPTLAVPHEQLAVPMTIEFDDAIRQLAGLERMYAEPDGSFVWTSTREGLSWQVDGNLFEKDGRVLLVDMKGGCPPAEFDRLLGCFGWPGEAVMMQLVRPAVFLDEATFRRHALARGTEENGRTLPG